MSHSYQAVGWNRQKKIYDIWLWLGIGAYMGLFVAVSLILPTQVSVETLIIRATGTCALLMLHILLLIGPLCRLCPRLLPLLYNRRHFGVSLFIIALTHGIFCIIQFHGFGDLNPLISVWVTSGEASHFSDYPFQPLGFLALVVLFLMAATSHDFWLANLTAPVWKALHMFVYLAYGLLVMHVLLGVLQAETNPIYFGLLISGVLLVAGLHLLAAFLEQRKDNNSLTESTGAWVATVAVADIPNNRAKIVSLAGERVAIFKYDNKVSAVSNVCQHQNGPLGEGMIIDGCITCPWHGYQYEPHSGCSPPPFTEKIPTFRVKIDHGIVWVDATPLAPGTSVEPAIIDLQKE